LTTVAHDHLVILPLEASSVRCLKFIERWKRLRTLAT